jgi:hypothetical protein
MGLSFITDYILEACPDCISNKLFITFVRIAFVRSEQAILAVTL